MAAIVAPGLYLARATCVAVLATVAVFAVSSARHPRVAFPPPARWFATTLRPSSDAIEFAVRSGGVPSQVTVEFAGRQASFLHPPRQSVRYRVEGLASGRGGGRIAVRVEPAASVVFDPGPVGIRTEQPRLRWQAAGPPIELPPPLSADPNRPWAEASVDETDTWGLRLLGVPVRAEPAVDAAFVAEVSHGDRLRARCWVRGDRVTNGFPERPTGAYESDVWYLLERPVGFVPDVRFGRRGAGDRLGLPACDAPIG